MNTMKSLTPMAEYLEMMYTRAAIELGTRNWRLELLPPLDPDDHTTGTLMLVAYVDNPSQEKNPQIISYRCSLKSVDYGARAPVEAIETVIEYHLREFMELVKFHEEGGEVEKG